VSNASGTSPGPSGYGSPSRPDGAVTRSDPS
jgi:hypothetical protein